MRKLQIVHAIACALTPLKLQAEKGKKPNLKTFTIGVEHFFYAPHYYLQDGHFAGFGRDVLDLFAKSKGYEIILSDVRKILASQSLH